MEWILLIIVFLAGIAIVAAIGAIAGFISGYAAAFILKVTACVFLVALFTPFVYIGAVFSCKQNNAIDFS